jgi:hypothetical protein
MVVPNTTSSGVVFLPRHDDRWCPVLNCTGIFCTKSAEEPHSDAKQPVIPTEASH